MKEENDTTTEENEVIPTVGEPEEFEYKTIRDARGRVYNIERPIVSDNGDFPKKHRMTARKGPGRPPKKKVEE